MIRYPSPELKEVDDLLRAGKAVEAGAVLLELSTRKIPRANLAAMAELLRRAFLPARTIQLLHRYVWSERGSTATDQERAEYAASLIELGASREAMELLSQVNSVNVPMVHCYRAYAQTRQWDWSAAIPHFRDFLAHRAVHDLELSAEKRWAELNLALALLHGPGDTDAASALLEGLLKNTDPRRFQMIYKSALWALLQVQVVSKHWADARATVARLDATGAPASEGSVYTIAIDQWKAYVTVGSSRDRAAGMRAVRAVRERARTIGAWENVRSCDFFESKLFGNRKLAIQLLFGTPHPALRSQILGVLGKNANLPNRFEWACFHRPQPDAARLDVTNGENTRSRGYLKEGQLLQRLLQILASDFYQPLQLAELHERLYPRQHFHPTASPLRIHQALLRLRRWIDQQGLPLQIEEYKGTYRLWTGTDCVLVVPRFDGTSGTARPPHARMKSRRQAEVLKRFFGARSFQSMEAARRLRISGRSALRVLADLCAQGVLERIGNGPGTRYRAAARPGSRQA